MQHIVWSLAPAMEASHGAEPSLQVAEARPLETKPDPQSKDAWSWYVERVAGVGERGREHRGGDCDESHSQHCVVYARHGGGRGKEMPLEKC